MSYRHTLAVCRPIVAEPLNMGAADERIPGYVNQCCERLLYGDEKGATAKWPGTYGKYRVAPISSCLTWVREFETIERYAICGRSAPIRNEWYEFLESGPGLLDSCCGAGWFPGSGLIDDNEACAFDDVTGPNATKKLEVYSDVDEAVGAKIILRFWNDSAQKVRSQVDGVWTEGEHILLPAGGAYTQCTEYVMPAGGPYQVIKPVTNGTVRLYEYDTVNQTRRPLAYYEPSETIPIYRRSRIPGFTAQPEAATDPCAQTTITVVAKFRFIPVIGDYDFVQIPSIAAIKLGCMAVAKEEKNLLTGPNGALEFWKMAYALLNQQTAHYQGAGAEVPINFRCGQSWGGAIPSLR